MLLEVRHDSGHFWQMRHDRSLSRGNRIFRRSLRVSVGKLPVALITPYIYCDVMQLDSCRWQITDHFWDTFTKVQIFSNFWDTFLCPISPNIWGKVPQNFWIWSTPHPFLPKIPKFFLHKKCPYKGFFFLP